MREKLDTQFERLRTAFDDLIAALQEEVRREAADQPVPAKVDIPPRDLRPMHFDWDALSEN